jgi:hypothetical protein
MRRCSAGVGFVLHMFEDFSYDARLSNESHDAEGASARTQKWVELENSSDQICPPTTQSLFSGGAEGWLNFLSLVWRRNGRVGEFRNFSSSSDVRVVPVIEQQMSPWLWDLDDDAGQELESVDFFEPLEELSGVVVRGSWSVENVSRGFGPLQSGKAHGRSKHVASDCFERVVFARGDPHGIVDGEATSLP